MRISDALQNALIGALYPAAAFAPGGVAFVWCGVGGICGGLVVATILVGPPRERALRLLVAICMAFGLGPGFMEIARIPESASIALLVGTVLAIGGWGTAVAIQEALPTRFKTWLKKAPGP